MKYTCPVCGYPDLDEKPINHEICPSCGTQFGYDDYLRPHADLRQEWLDSGANWFLTGFEPYRWNPYRQLQNAGYFEFRENSKTESAVNVMVFDDTSSQNLPNHYDRVTLGVRWVTIGTSGIGIGCETVV
jgi:Cysteine-rich CPCC